MHIVDPWQSIRAGNVSDGLVRLRRSCDGEPSPSHIMELGAAYLWIKKYEMAWELFAKSIQDYPNSMSSFYGMAGVAAWCLGRVREAVQQWRDGLQAKYKDTDGLGVRIPLLLFTASRLEVDSFDGRVALGLLADKARDARIKSWPGPIVLWVLGMSSESELSARIVGQDLVESYDRRWIVSFYRALASRSPGQDATFERAMRELTDTSVEPWTNHDFFLARMWSEEFFLARHAVA